MTTTGEDGLTVEDVVEVLPDLIARALRSPGNRPPPPPGAATTATGIVITAGDTTAEVQLDDDEPGVLAIVQLSAAVSAGDRVLVLVSESGSAFVVGNGNAAAQTGAPFLRRDQNLSDLDDPEAGRENLGSPASLPDITLIAAPFLGMEAYNSVDNTGTGGLAVGYFQWDGAAWQPRPVGTGSGFINVLDYGAHSNFLPPLKQVSSTVATSLFGKTNHGLVVNDHVVLTGLSDTTGVTNGTEYVVRTVPGPNSFTLKTTLGVAITLGGTDQNAAAGTPITVKNLPSNPHNNGNVTVNKAAFAAAWLVAKAAKKILYIPAGDYGIPANILTTTNSDAGIIGDGCGNTTLWLIDDLAYSGGTGPTAWAGTDNGVCISQSMRDADYWSGSAERIPPITGILISGTYAGNDSIGMRVGPCVGGHWDVVCNSFTGTGGAVGTHVKGITGGIGILAQNANDALGNNKWTEESTFGPTCSLVNNTYGLVIDKGPGAASFGYNSFQHLFLGVSSGQVGILIANDAWLYSCDMVVKGNGPQSGGGGTLFKMTASSISAWVSGTPYLDGDVVTDSGGSSPYYVNLHAVTSTTAPHSDPTNWAAAAIGNITTRLTGHVAITLESVSGPFTTIAMDDKSVWLTEGYIDFQTFSANTVAPDWTPGRVFFHDGTLLMPNVLNTVGWGRLPNITQTSGAADAASTFTVPGDETGTLKAGRRIRWSESGTVKETVITDVAYAPNSTTVTLAAEHTNYMSTNPDIGSGAQSPIPETLNTHMTPDPNGIVNVIRQNSGFTGLRTYEVAPTLRLESVRGSSGSPTATLALNPLGAFAFGGSSNTTPTIYTAAGIRGRSLENWSGSSSSDWITGAQVELFATQATTNGLTTVAIAGWTGLYAVRDSGSSTGPGAGVTFGTIGVMGNTTAAPNTTAGSWVVGGGISVASDEPSSAWDATHQHARLQGFSNASTGGGGNIIGWILDSAQKFYVGPTKASAEFSVDANGYLAGNSNRLYFVRDNGTSSGPGAGVTLATLGVMGNTTATGSAGYVLGGGYRVISDEPTVAWDATHSRGRVEWLFGPGGGTGVSPTTGAILDSNGKFYVGATKAGALFSVASSGLATFGIVPIVNLSGVSGITFIDDPGAAVANAATIATIKFQGAGDAIGTYFSGATISVVTEEAFATTGGHSGSRIVFATSAIGASGAQTTRGGYDSTGTMFVGTNGVRVFTVDVSGNMIAGGTALIVGVATFSAIPVVNVAGQTGVTFVRDSGAAFASGTILSTVSWQAAGDASHTLLSAASVVVTSEELFATSGSKAGSRIVFATTGISSGINDGLTTRFGADSAGVFFVGTNAARIMEVASTGSGKFGIFGATAVAQQTDGAALTNSVTTGGTTNTIANFTNLSTYSADANAIRNDIYQLARKLKIVDDALRLYGWLT